MADETKYTGLVCRGSWAMGSACGKCERCERTRPPGPTIPESMFYPKPAEPLFKTPAKPTSELPVYRAAGLHVMARPVVQPNGGCTMGFRVCTVNEYVEGGAEEIARALNAAAVPTTGPAVQFPDAATVERLRSAIDVAVKNLRQGLLADIGVVQHVVRSLEDALNG